MWIWNLSLIQSPDSRVQSHYVEVESSACILYLELQVAGEAELELLEAELAVAVVVGVRDPLLHLADPEPVLDQLARLLGLLGTRVEDRVYY